MNQNDGIEINGNDGSTPESGRSANVESLIAILIVYVMTATIVVVFGGWYGVSYFIWLILFTVWGYLMLVFDILYLLFSETSYPAHLYKDYNLYIYFSLIAVNVFSIIGYICSLIFV